MAYHEFQYPLPLNKARQLCERAIARLAPVWLPPNGISSTATQSPYTITETGQVVSDDEPTLLTVDVMPEPDYMNGLTEVEKSQVRSVSGGDTERAAYAATLRNWRESKA
jgi:hypothetical protein